MQSELRLDPVTRAVGCSFARSVPMPDYEKLAVSLEVQPKDRLAIYLKSSIRATNDFNQSHPAPVKPFFDVESVIFPDEDTLVTCATVGRSSFDLCDIQCLYTAQMPQHTIANIPSKHATSGSARPLTSLSKISTKSFKTIIRQKISKIPAIFRRSSTKIIPAV